VLDTAPVVSAVHNAQIIFGQHTDLTVEAMKAQGLRNGGDGLVVDHGEGRPSRPQDVTLDGIPE
jgi:hypothetical protein